MEILEEEPETSECGGPHQLTKATRLGVIHGVANGDLLPVRCGDALSLLGSQTG